MDQKKPEPNQYISQWISDKCEVTNNPDDIINIQVLYGDFTQWYYETYPGQKEDKPIFMVWVIKLKNLGFIISPNPKTAQGLKLVN